MTKENENQNSILTGKWHCHICCMAYTTAEIAYGINEYKDGPKGTVCSIKIPSWIPIEERQKIIEIIANANNSKV